MRRPVLACRSARRRTGAWRQTGSRLSGGRDPRSPGASGAPARRGLRTGERLIGSNASRGNAKGIGPSPVPTKKRRRQPLTSNDRGGAWPEGRKSTRSLRRKHGSFTRFRAVGPGSASLPTSRACPTGAAAFPSPPHSWGGGPPTRFSVGGGGGVSVSDDMGAATSDVSAAPSVTAHICAATPPLQKGRKRLNPAPHSSDVGRLKPRDCG